VVTVVNRAAALEVQTTADFLEELDVGYPFGQAEVFHDSAVVVQVWTLRLRRYTTIRHAALGSLRGCPSEILVQIALSQSRRASREARQPNPYPARSWGAAQCTAPPRQV
jgi:hypothetical protein